MSAEGLDPHEYANRLSGTRVDNLVRAAVAALLEEYRAELARDSQFILEAASKLLQEVSNPDLFYSNGSRCWFLRGENEAGGLVAVDGDTLAEVYTALVEARKDGSDGNP